MAAFLPPEFAEIGVTIFAVGIVLIFTLINVMGTRSVGRSETFIVGVKLAILLLFACVGVFFIKPSLLAISHQPSMSNIIIGACILFLGYEGFGLITNTSEDIEQPQKNIPRALYMAVIFTLLIYVFVSIVLVGSLSIPEITETADYALAAAAEPFAGSIGFTIIAIAALFSTASAINATLFGGANVSYLMARKGELPKFFNRNTWHNSKEGLFLTSFLVITFTIFLDL